MPSAPASDSGLTTSIVAPPQYFPYGRSGNCRRPPPTDRRSQGSHAGQFPFPADQPVRYRHGRPLELRRPGHPAGFGRRPVTLVDESTFAISGGAGDISSGAAQGLFFRDTRILSHFEVVLNGVRAEPLAVVTDDPFSATFVARDIPAPGGPTPP